MIDEHPPGRTFLSANRNPLALGYHLKASFLETNSEAKALFFHGLVLRFLFFLVGKSQNQENTFTGPKKWRAFKSEFVNIVLYNVGAVVNLHMLCYMNGDSR